MPRSGMYPSRKWYYKSALSTAWSIWSFSRLSTRTSTTFYIHSCPRSWTVFLEKRHGWAQCQEEGWRKTDFILSYDEMSDSDGKVAQFTGLPSKHHFNILLSLISKYKINYYLGWNVEKVSIENQLLCTLMKLRLNLPLFVLSTMFGVVDATIHNIVLTFIHVIHRLLFEGMMQNIPSKEQNRAVILHVLLHLLMPE